jgi:hypothetical protein
VVLGVIAAVAGVLAWTASAASADQAARGGMAPARHVVIVGIGGLLWSDVTPRATPVLWRLARGNLPPRPFDRYRQVHRYR